MKKRPETRWIVKSVNMYVCMCACWCLCVGNFICEAYIMHTDHIRISYLYACTFMIMHSTAEDTRVYIVQVVDCHTMLVCIFVCVCVCVFYNISVILSMYL
jgi:hypothetical protein